MVSFSGFFDKGKDQGRSKQGADSASSAVERYLQDAHAAVADGHNKLAVHLFIAAFEMEQTVTALPTKTVLEGMEEAWELSCSMVDRSSAETIFTELAAYSTPEQVNDRAIRLQDMAVDQLAEMGIPKDRISRARHIFTPDATAAGADPGFASKLYQMLSEIAADGEGPDDADDESQEGWRGKRKKPVMPQWRMEPEDEAGRDYSALVGYDDALKSMRAYGFDTADDEEYRRFVEDNSLFHGMEGLALYEPFLFYGPSRADVFEFAEATAGEIGNPVVTLHVRTDDEGMWTIKLSGPFRRSMLGMTDPTDVPVPCTFIIENIDMLQDFVKAAVKAESEAGEEGMGMRGSRVYGELLGYIHALLQKPGVFPIITAQSDVKLLPQLDDFFERAQRIRIDNPSVEERRSLWGGFAVSHASFSGIDLDELARVSGGVSRHDLLTAGRNAVRNVFQGSLVENAYKFVSINDVLFELVPFASSDDSAYRALEDAAASAFDAELDEMLFEGGDEPE